MFSRGMGAQSNIMSHLTPPCLLATKKVEELAFAATGEAFLTRDTDGGTVSLWSVKPDVTHVQVEDKLYVHDDVEVDVDTQPFLL